MCVSPPHSNTDMSICNIGVALENNSESKSTARQILLCSVTDTDAMYFHHSPTLASLHVSGSYDPTRYSRCCSG